MIKKNRVYFVLNLTFISRLIREKQLNMIRHYSNSLSFFIRSSDNAFKATYFISNSNERLFEKVFFLNWMDMSYVRVYVYMYV